MSFLDRRSLTVPVHRRRAQSCQKSSPICKSDRSFENASKLNFFTPDIKNTLIAFRGAKTFWKHHSSWRPVQRRLDSAIGKRAEVSNEWRHKISLHCWEKLKSIRKRDRALKSLQNIGDVFRENNTLHIQLQQPENRSRHWGAQWTFKIPA